MNRICLVIKCWPPHGNIEWEFRVSTSSEDSVYIPIDNVDAKPTVCLPRDVVCILIKNPKLSY